jgi:PilZ domain
MSDSTGPIEAELTVLRTQLTAQRRRANGRYRCALASAGKVVFDATGETMTVWLSNLSITGVAIHLPRALEADEPLMIQVRVPGRAEPIRLAAKVVHCTCEVDGSWRVGCVFTAPLSDEALESLL